MQQPDQLQAQPKKAFAALFFIEMWERFGYYGMQAIMVLFLVDALTNNADLAKAAGLDGGNPETRAVLIWGAMVSMVYALTMVGGFIGDKVLGARRTMTLGAITLMIGYALLAIPSAATLFFAMGVISIGNGLFKVNPNNLVSRLYPNDPSKLDSTFTIYYMSINIGSLISIAATPIVANNFGWHVAFGVSAIGLALGLLNYFFMRRAVRPYGSAPDFEKLHWGKLIAVIVGSLIIAAIVSYVIRYNDVTRGVIIAFAIVALGIFAYLMITEPQYRGRLAACLVLLAIVIVFFIYYQQMSTSLTLFAKHNVYNAKMGSDVATHGILGISILPAQFQDFNPFWIVILSPIMAGYYTHRANTKGDFSMPTKYAAGLFVSSLAFFVFAASGLFAGADGIVSGWWLVAGYGLQSAAELIISALGLSMIVKLVPERLRGLLLGAFFLATAISQYLGSVVATIASVPENVTEPTQSISLFTGLFTKLGIAALIAAIIAALLVPWLKRLIGEDPSLRGGGVRPETPEGDVAIGREV
ncbi:MAG TPA: oligopeptide:H+ symporter [Gammaproteobacteria bacterium]|nr:oligopeptide:H+ symporter [Gammaproteobacteria bacterium]